MGCRCLRFAGLVLLGVLLALLPLLPVQPAPAPPPDPALPRRELRGVWLTLYPVAWNGGYAWYPSEVTQRRGLQAFTVRGLQGQDPLPELVAEAHAHGLLVVPWFEFGFMAPPSSELATRHPDWLTRRRDGGLTSVSAAGEVVWLNPFRPEVQQLITELVLEIVERSGAGRSPGSGLAAVARRADHGLHGPAARRREGAPSRGDRVGVAQLPRLRLQAPAPGLAHVGAAGDRG